MPQRMQFRPGKRELRKKNTNISPEKQLGKLKIIFKLAVIENCKQMYFSSSLVFLSFFGIWMV